MNDDKNILPDRPDGWVWTKLGEVCLKPQYGWTTSAATEGGIQLLRTTDITSGNIDWGSVPFCKKEPSEKEKYLLEDGDIVISRAGSVGYSHLIKNPKEAVFASYLIRFKPLIEERYLAFFLKSPSYWSAISDKSIGIALPNVNATKLKQIFLPLPPLAEQHRIVDKIEELFTKLDAGIESLKKAQVQLKRYRQAVLKSAMEGKLTEEWRSAHKDELEPASVLLERIEEERKKKTERFKNLLPLETSDLPQLPEGWVWTRLEYISDIILGQSPPSSTYNENGDGLPFYQGKLEFGQTYPTPRKWCSAPKKIAEKGDVLISVRAPVGPTNICPERSCIGRGLAAIRGLGEIETLFILYLIRAFENVISGKGTGTTFKAIRGSQLRGFEIPLPPLAEQHKIVEEIERRLSVADEVEKTVESELKRSARLRQSILKQAFSGKLVPQVLDDEPASVFLEKIKAEKAQQESKKTSRKKSKAKTNAEQMRLF